MAASFTVLCMLVLSSPLCLYSPPPASAGEATVTIGAQLPSRLLQESESHAAAPTSLSFSDVVRQDQARDSSHVFPSTSSVWKGFGATQSGDSSHHSSSYRSQGIRDSEADLASQGEDQLLETARQLDTRLESAFGALTSELANLNPAAQKDSSAAQALSRELITEVWEVVDNGYLDARGTGWDRDKWRSLRDEALSHTHRDISSAHRSIKDMLVRGLSDPYSRFIPASELAAMKKYDVTGVGLNLGTAEEFQRKTGLSIQAGRVTPSPGGGIYVVGLSRGSPADTAGISQGDEIVGVQGTTLDPSVTPFQAASFIQSGGTQLLQSYSAPSPASTTAPVADSSSLAAASSTSSSGGSSGSSGSNSSGSRAPLLSDDMTLQVRRINGVLVDVSMPRPMRTAIPSPVSYSIVQDTPPSTSKQNRSNTSSSSGSSSDYSGWWENTPVQRSSKQARQVLVTSQASSPSSSSSSSSDATAKVPRATTTQTSADKSILASTGTSTGLIKLSSFNARAQRDLAAAVTDLDSRGVGRFVLDLRDNRGGLVSEGLEVARLFLDGGARIVLTEGRSGPSEAPLAMGPSLTKKPLLVLVNEHTASASEIVAGALRDNCRAVLAGNKTYGKGLIQSVFELSDGSGLVVTVGKYLTPARTDIDRTGIVPDFASPPSHSDFEATLNACRLPV